MQKSMLLRTTSQLVKTDTHPLKYRRKKIILIKKTINANLVKKNYQ